MSVESIRQQLDLEKVAFKYAYGPEEIDAWLTEQLARYIAGQGTEDIRDITLFRAPVAVPAEFGRTADNEPIMGVETIDAEFLFDARTGKTYPRPKPAWGAEPITDPGVIWVGVKGDWRIQVRARFTTDGVVYFVPELDRKSERAFFKGFFQAAAPILPVVSVALAFLAPGLGTAIGQAVLPASLAASAPILAPIVGNIALGTAFSGGNVEAAVIGALTGAAGGLVGGQVASATESAAAGRAAAAATSAALRGGDIKQAVAFSLAQSGASSLQSSIAPTSTAPSTEGKPMSDLYSLTSSSSQGFSFEQPAAFAADYSLAQGDGGFGLQVEMPAADWASGDIYAFGGDPGFGLDVSGIDFGSFDPGAVDYSLGVLGSGGAGLDFGDLMFPTAGDIDPIMFSGPEGPEWGWTGKASDSAVVVDGSKNAPAAAPASSGSDWVVGLTNLALAAIKVNAAYQSTKAPPRTQTISGTTTKTANPNGTLTVRNTATGATALTRPEVGVPYVLADGSTIINNGNGTYTTVKADGSSVTRSYDAAGGAGIGSMLSSIHPAVWAIGGVGLVLALSGRGR